MRNVLRGHGLSLTSLSKIKNKIMPKPGKCYPCLCEITKKVLLLARVSGILPIKSVLGKDIRSCSFATSNYLIAYSAVLQILYFLYFCFVYSIRWYCSENKSYKNIDWYLMTVGYLVADVDSMVTLLLGVIRSRRICRILERLSKLDSSIIKGKKLKTYMARVIWILLLYFGIKIFSLFHGTLFLSSFKSGLFVLNCSSLESTFAVLIRGLTVFFPTIQIAIVYMFVAFTEEKFEYLADSMALTIESMNSVNEKKSHGLIYINTVGIKEEKQIKNDDKFTKALDRLADTHLEIFSIVSEINYCTGFQLLMGNCSSLYTMIYYLFRYITFTADKPKTKSSKFYYVLSLFYRLTKVTTCMVLGQRLHNKLQTLMMQWSGKKAYLSACGVVNFGPWLLAPIAGNIITYLLVALQFDDVSPNDDNTTSVEHSMMQSVV